MSLQKTPLHEDCLKLGCRMASFAGWEMPIQFSGLINEHQAVREKAGLFDISHMGVFLAQGKKAKEALQNLIPTDLYRIGAGEACYTVLLNENGGIIDDLIIYDLGTDSNDLENLLLVINAGCIDKDINWIKKNINQEKVSISDFKKNGVLIAIQGQQSLKELETLIGENLSLIPRFGHKYINLYKNNKYGKIFIARTGYTGEEGFELLLGEKEGKYLWSDLISQEVTPCGLGARDTLRLEAAMHLYGNELNNNTTPFEAGLGWLVHLEMSANFIGRNMLEKQAKEGISKQLVCLKIKGRAIARKGYKLLKNNKIIGEITSGSWSPTLGQGIAMGYVPVDVAKVGTEINIEIRNKQHKGTVVKRPFYRKK